MKKQVSSWVKEAEKKSTSFELSLHVLIEKEADLFSAHCLEFDIVADGNTVESAQKEIIMAIANHISFCIEYDNLDKIYNPAPPEYWNKFFIVGEEKTTHALPKENPFLYNKLHGTVKNVTFGTTKNAPCYV